MRHHIAELVLILSLAVGAADVAVAGGAAEAGGAATSEERAATPEVGEAEGPRAEERERLVERGVVAEGVTDPLVVEAMLAVPRHQFVPDQYQGSAYENRPLPIGEGQTISQPYVVAYMTELLELTPESSVLEVGTGSGYQAAVLAEIAESVHTIEIIEPLALTARDLLDRLDYDNVTVHVGDGYFGWEEAAPYDAIIVTAAAGHIPPPLLDQLRPNGRMVIPVGPVHSIQQLILVQKDEDGEVTTQQLLPVRFVPMTGRVQE